MPDKLPKSHSRTFARYYALRLLYQLELAERLLDDVLEEEILAISQDQIEDCLHLCDKKKNCEQFKFFELFAEEPKGYVLDIVRGYEEHRADIDLLLDSVLEHWSLYRMPPADRSIARIGVWEIMYNDSVPDSVAVNEAVTLAKEFGGDDSSKFINGVLGKVVKLKEAKEKFQDS
jgi:transcription antitermination factor NusB